MLSIDNKVLQDIDLQYYLILPYFYNLEFETRKRTDFLLWMIGVLLFKRGYFYMSFGRELLFKLTNNINTKRYSTQVNKPILLTPKDVKEVFQ